MLPFGYGNLFLRLRVDPGGDRHEHGGYERRLFRPDVAFREAVSVYRSKDGEDRAFREFVQKIFHLRWSYWFQYFITAYSTNLAFFGNFLFETEMYASVSLKSSSGDFLAYSETYVLEFEIFHQAARSLPFIFSQKR